MAQTQQQAPPPPESEAHPFGNLHQWGMVVDIDLCTGCQACVVACQAENNIALNDEPAYQQRRPKEWIRVERYGRPMRDGDVQPACAQACPTNALIFGDWNDQNSRINRLRRDPRHYTMLEDLGTEPVVVYLKKVDPNALPQELEETHGGGSP